MLGLDSLSAMLARSSAAKAAFNSPGCSVVVIDADFMASSEGMINHIENKWMQAMP
ncbi:MAG: hypothetical protein KZQ88_02290 [Candidatus Thiodiazotropha sp. (ex Dulcina madagascariensis)]|nr:hypothetical protein [Candidatus Thiodiazotropha sp. (ex Dulcina madagascariensis)]MCU7927258.1 hypothetical protein [Candidatus Thiodiazotropha sp. (ex Dulcina madagascariensis)]